MSEPDKATQKIRDILNGTGPCPSEYALYADSADPRTWAAWGWIWQEVIRKRERRDLRILS